MFSGTFIEFRNGMINVSPIGRNCRYFILFYFFHSKEYNSNINLFISVEERNAFEEYDKVFNEEHFRQFT